eukprot:PhF_6_TR10118/c0_g1_i1/m.15733
MQHEPLRNMSPFLGFNKNQGRTPGEEKAYTKWRQQLREDITNQGKSDDAKEEELHLRFMLNNNLRGYVCHQEVSKYAECLVKKKVIPSMDQINIEVNQKLAQVKCEPEVKAYEKCMKDDENHRLISFEAIQHDRCQNFRKTFMECLEKNVTNQDVCKQDYRASLRCGLNFMWNEYWKNITGYGDSEEYHTFAGSREQRRLEAIDSVDLKISNIAKTVSGQ